MFRVYLLVDLIVPVVALAGRYRLESQIARWADVYATVEVSSGIVSGAEGSKIKGQIEVAS